MIRNLDLTSLRSFVAIADAGGVTRAAGFLNLTQSAVSMQIKRLEEVLGCDVLDRSARIVGLTAEGEQLLGYARKMLALNDEAFHRLTTDVHEGEIVLGVPHDIVYPAIPQVLRRFAAEHPRLRLGLRELSSSEQLVELVHDRLDLQVRRGEVRVNGELMGDASALLALADDVGGASAPAIAQPSLATPSAAIVDKRAVAAQQCPDFSQGGTSLSYSSDDLYAPQSMSVVAGGSVNLSNCPSIPGLGYVTQAPDYKLEFSGNSAGRELEFRLDSACDTVLLLNDTNGTWHHDDDSNGNLDAKIRLPKASNGVYDIWVGTLNADNCDATLTIETF
jgi:DNA-binding transcriptional LysR family regulator